MSNKDDREYSSFAGFAVKMRLFVDQAVLPEVQTYLAPYGYDPARIGEGRLLLERAEAAWDEKHEARGVRKGATETMNAKGRLVWMHFGMGQLAARETLRGRLDLLSALGMTPRRPRRKRAEGETLKRVYISQSFSTRVRQAQTFYDNALASPEIIAFLSARGYDAARLTEGRALLADWIAANDAQEAAKGALTLAYDELDAARGTARRWYLDVRMIARRALRGRKDLLHMLGID